MNSDGEIYTAIFGAASKRCEVEKKKYIQFPFQLENRRGLKSDTLHRVVRLWPSTTPLQFRTATSTINKQQLHRMRTKIVSITTKIAVLYNSKAMEMHSRHNNNSCWLCR